MSAWKTTVLFAGAASSLFFGCSSAGSSAPVTSGGRDGGLITGDPVDMPLDHATSEQESTFIAGDGLFDQTFRDADGLGPLYIRTSCGSCHQRGVRGPGIVQKVALVEGDGTTPAPDQSPLSFGHTLRPFYTAGATQPIASPDRSDAKVTFRAAASVLGRGYLEAVADSEIERVAREQQGRSDGVHGHINRVTYRSEANPTSHVNHHQPGDTLIGRFGLKARIATLDEFAADAFQGDMGITSPLRPAELPNPDGLADDWKPGADVTLETVNTVGDYMRLIEIPKRQKQTDRGLALFTETSCATCHVPTLRTSADYPVAQLANIDAPVFTDFLVHDMGADLADGMTDETATSREWRSAPLIGVRFMRSYMHDGRARSVLAAIQLHGAADSEGKDSADRFNALSDADRAALLEFVSGL